MERSEHNEFSSQSVPTEINLNGENDEINANTTPDWLFDDQNKAKLEDSVFDIFEGLENFVSVEESWNESGTTNSPNEVTPAINWDDFFTAQRESFIPTEDCYDDAGTFPSQNQVDMSNCSVDWNYPETVSPQNEIAELAGNREPETVVGSLAASAEFSPANLCTDEIYADTTPDQLRDDQNQSTIEDCLFYINENLENCQFIEEIWNEPGATNSQNQVPTANSWDNYVTTQLQNDENANATPDQQTDNQNRMAGIGDCLLDISEQLESLQPTEEDWNNPGATHLQNQLTEASSWDKFVAAQLECPMPTEERCHVFVSLEASKVFSAAKLFDNGSQPCVTLHQKVESTTEETSTPPQVLQSATPPVPNGKYYICTICKPSCQFVRTNTKAHIISLHSDVYFLSSKLASVLQNDFKEYCTYLVKNLVLSSHRLYDRDVNPLLGCNLCCYTCRREDHMHYHLCSTHEHMVREKLVRLQQDTTSITELRAKANELENSCFSDSYCFRCLSCCKKFRSHISFHRHIKQADCENTSGAGTSRSKKDISHSRVPSNHPVTCENCDPPKQFKKCDLLLHNVQHHIETLLISSKTESLSKEEHKKNCEDVMDKELLSCKRKSDSGSGKTEFVCSFCPNVLTRKQTMRYHLYCKHKSILLKKLHAASGKYKSMMNY